MQPTSRLLTLLVSCRLISRIQTQLVCRSASARNMASTSSIARVSRLYDDEPAFIYGTAWKKDQTKRLVKEALMHGFRRVDTAAQPRHYQEELVGEALREAYTEGVIARRDLYVSLRSHRYGSARFTRNRFRQNTRLRPAKMPVICHMTRKLL